MSANTAHSVGFTLIELMITVAIVGILAAIAYPSYQQHVLGSWRANGASCLAALAQRMERRYTTDSTYAAPANDTLFTLPCTVDGNMPDRYSFSYEGTPDASSFELRATPVSNGPQASDRCGKLTINQRGQTRIADAAEGVSPQDCWRR